VYALLEVIQGQQDLRQARADYALAQYALTHATTPIGTRHAHPGPADGKGGSGGVRGA
jgi:hypothetical protein